MSWLEEALANPVITQQLPEATLETVFMTLLASLVTVVLGLPLGLALVTTSPGGLRPATATNAVLSAIVNVGRSFPFIILMVAILPLTRLLTGTTYGWRSAVVPLSLAAIPFFARLVETAVREVSAGKVEAARMVGASRLAIVGGVLVREALPAIVGGITVTVITLVGYSAMAGALGAGGLGALRVLEGLIAYFEQRDLPPPPKVVKRAQQQFEEEEFGFCTEFLLAEVSVPTKEIQEMVAPFGDSLLVVGAEGFVKGHIHTQEPERLLATVGRYGRMVRSKVEDMSEQHSEILADVELSDEDAPRIAAVAVASGYGLTRAFRSLGVRVVGGGQTDNPSVEDLSDAVRSVGAQTVIIMPNNKNVIMAAERVNEIVPDKRVVVLPTRTLGQGLAASVVFTEDGDPETVLEEMRSAAEDTVTLEVTSASRDVQLEGVDVQEGQAIGLRDGVLEVAAADPEQALLELVERHAGDRDIASLFHGATITDEEVEELVGRLGELQPDLEIEVHPGGPDLYPYLMVLE